MKIIDTLIKQLREQGYESRIVSIRRLKDLYEMIHEFHNKGLLNKELYEDYFSLFSPDPPEKLKSARSLIIMARKDPPTEITFYHKGKAIKTIVPPTYLYAQKNTDRARSVITDLLKLDGHKIEGVIVPRKLLAVCSGLAEYGKNNITYIEGLGSYHRLTPFCSDLPCDSDEWHRPVMMEQCGQCDKCTRSCPTNAILQDRFLLDVDRCITFWNEKDPDVEFPEWLNPAWHNCLIGCMICQKSCPANSGVQDCCNTGAEFSEDETNMLLRGTPKDDMPQSLQDKLEYADLAFSELLPRNLKVIMR
jgi:epoxyqueuosine reductase